MAPSLEQLRLEQFADAVERAVARPLHLFDPEPLVARILTKNGHQIEFTVREVDIDGGQLVGSGLGNQPIHLPLGNVKSVWRRRSRTGRSVAVWLSPMVAGAIAGAMVASGMGAVVGGLLGAIVGALAARIVHNWQGMWEWEQLYDAARIVT